MSYAKNAGGHNDPTPFNHFVIFDELNLLACHDYKVVCNSMEERAKLARPKQKNKFATTLSWGYLHLLMRRPSVVCTLIVALY